MRGMSAQAGEGQLVLVIGEAGIGKTRLLQTAMSLLPGKVSTAPTRGAASSKSELGWGVAVDILDQLLKSLSAIQRAELLSGRAAPAQERAHWCPRSGYGSRSPNVAEVVSAMSLVVRRLSDERPIAVAVDDAHWADVSSLRWLASIARSHRGRAGAAVSASGRWSRTRRPNCWTASNLRRAWR